MTEKKEKRKRAYQYLAWIAETHLGAPPNFSHKKLAEVLGDLSDIDRFSIGIALNRLKDGQLDPSPKLIAELKRFLGPTIPADFDSYLVTPFLTDP